MHLQLALLLCSQKYDITLVSPRNYFLYTPLLPAVATGTVEERSIVEPIRRIMAGKVSNLRGIRYVTHMHGKV